MNEWIDGWMHEWMGELIQQFIADRMNELVNQCYQKRVKNAMKVKTLTTANKNCINSETEAW